MIGYETYCKIRHLHEQEGLSVSQIVKHLGLNERTVAKWLKAQQYCQRKSSPRPSKLDPFKPEILRMLERYPYTGEQIRRHLYELGYTGSRSTLNAYIHTVRPRRAPAYLTLNFAPGECAQVDWGEWGTVEVGSTRRRLSFFVMVLCYSRMLYVRFTLGQGEDLLELELPKPDLSIYAGDESPADETPSSEQGEQDNGQETDEPKTIG